MKSLFTPLKEEKLTTAKIRYNFKTDSVRLYGAKEWDDTLDFSRYNKDFYLDDIYTEDAVYLNTKDMWNLYEKYGLREYLEEVIDLLRQGKHFGIDLYYYAQEDIRYMMHQHSRKLGVNNKSQCIMAGGIRRHSPDEEEIEVIIDGLNLGRGMSFKNVAGNLAFGGCKATVQMEPLDIKDLKVMGFLAYAIDVCRDMVGPDMNFPTEMSDVMIKEGFSVQYTGGPSSKTGETGKPTAYGVFLTLKEALKIYEETDSLKGKKVALMGLGAVGWYMGEYLLEEDVELLISDISSERVAEFLDKHPNKNIQVVSPTEILFQDVDIISPCAIGGIFSEDNIPQLKCKYIWGSANNQLKASSQEEEIRLARLLYDNGIVFQTEWWHNTAGVICGAEEYLYDGDYNSLMEKVEKILPENTRKNLITAQEQGITPTEAAYKTCEKLIYG